MNFLLGLILNIIQLFRLIEASLTVFLGSVNSFVWLLGMVCFVVFFGYCLFLYFSTPGSRLDPEVKKLTS